jgi:hypothetical protein
MKFDEFVNESKIPFSKVKDDFSNLINDYLNGDWGGFKVPSDLTKFVKALEKEDYKQLSVIFNTLKVDSIAKFVKLYGDYIKATY